MPHSLIHHDSGIISIYLIYSLGKRWFSAFTGLFASAVFSVFQFSILYSFFARPYSPGLLFGLLAAYYWTKLFFPITTKGTGNSNLLNWIGFTLAMIACTHTHYFSFVFAGGVGLSGLFFMRKEILRPYLISGIVILTAFIPEWQIFSEQLSTGDIGGWLAPPGIWYMPEFFMHGFNDSRLISLILLAMFLPGIFLLLRRKIWSKFHSLSIIWFLFSFLIAYLYSLLRHPVIQFSTLYFTFPFLIFVIASALETLICKIKGSVLLILLLLGLGFSGTLFSKGLFIRSQYGVFSDIVNDINEWQKELGHENVKTLVNVINPEYINYYFRQMNVEPEIYLWKVEDRIQIQKFVTALDSLDSPYFCFAWSNSGHPYEIISALREKFPVILKKKEYFNSAAYLFAKNGVSIRENALLNVEYSPSLGTWEPVNESLQLDHNFILDSLHNYGPGYLKSVKDIPGEKFRLISSRIDFRSREKELNAHMVISFDSAGTPLEYHSLNLDECNLVPGNWQTVYLTRVIHEQIPENLDLNVYLYNQDFRNIEIRKYRVTIENWENPYTISKEKN